VSAIGRWFRRVTNRITPSDELFYRAEKKRKEAEARRFSDLLMELPDALAFVEARLLSAVNRGDTAARFSWWNKKDYVIGESCKYDLPDFLDVGLKECLENRGYTVKVDYWPMSHRVEFIRVSVG
jgi:hypothetical protein